MATRFHTEDIGHGDIQRRMNRMLALAILVHSAHPVESSKWGRQRARQPHPVLKTAE
jgi:hypothetical protein